MTTFLYVVEAVYVIAAISFVAAWTLSRDCRYLVTTALFVLSAALSFFLSAWWLLLAGPVLSAMLFVRSAGSKA